MSFFDYYTPASILGQTLLHSLWQNALLALAAAIGFRLLRRRSASLRHAIGMLFLLAMMLTPLMTFVVLSPSILPRNVLPASSWLSMSLLAPPDAYRAVVTDVQMIVSRLPELVPLVCSVFWLLGLVITVLRQYGGWQLLKKLEQFAGDCLPASLQTRADALQRRMGIARFISIRVVPEKIFQHQFSPFTARCLRPIIWLPISVLTHLDADQIEALLAHEMAHIHRLDWFWNGLQCLAEALLFFHPAVWWLSRRIRQEREHACDELAVAVCGNAVALAEALTMLEQLKQERMRRQIQHSAMPIPRLGSALPRFLLAANGGTLVKRIKHLLSASTELTEPELERGSAVSRFPRLRWPLSAGLVALLTSGLLLAMQSDMQTFGATHLSIHFSDEYELTPGNYREIEAELLGQERYYRISMDDLGNINEIYKEDGITRPINAEVRAWLAKVDTLPPEPPSPPDVPAIPDIPAMPAIPDMPAPPAPPLITDSTEFKALFAAIAVDARVIEKLGTPISADAATFRGHIQNWDEDDLRLWRSVEPHWAKADFSLNVSGPKGRANIQVDAETERGVWRITALEL